MTGRDPFAAYRAELAAAGFRPSSSLGQNFLLDPTLHRVIAEAAAPGPADTVLEIGVGLGFLTRELLPRCARVVGVEIDERLCRIAGRELGPAPNLTLVRADALGGPGGTLDPAVAAAVADVAEDRLLVVANLPYAVSGPLVAELLAEPRLPRRIVVLVQRELAQRLAAAPGGRTYGSLAALVQTLYAPAVLRTVPPQVFRPRPKVASAILQLDRRPPVPGLGEALARRAFGRFVRRLFQQRRKTLRATLPDTLAELGGGPAPDLPAELLARRPEQLSPAEALELWRACGRPGEP